MTITARGVNGTVTFDGRYVTIDRGGVLGRSTVGKGTKRIPVASITAVQWKQPGMVNGYIEFTLPGGNESRSSFGTATFDAARNENAVVVSRRQRDAFLALRTAVEDALTGPAPVRQGPPPGFYRTADAEGERWWDGTAWTEHTR